MTCSFHDIYAFTFNLRAFSVYALCAAMRFFDPMTLWSYRLDDPMANSF
jgi:hypothetical protein